MKTDKTVYWLVSNYSCIGNSEREASESRILQLEKRVEEVARQANSAQIQVHEVELQLQASLASTYNGGFLWRIPEISRRRRDAVEERVMSLYSPPFYTARLVVCLVWQSVGV